MFEEKVEAGGEVEEKVEDRDLKETEETVLGTLISRLREILDLGDLDDQDDAGELLPVLLSLDTRQWFLLAYTRLYTSLCRSVRP